LMTLKKKTIIDFNVYRNIKHSEYASGCFFYIWRFVIGKNGYNPS